jgi:hypothetical protein
MRNMSQDGALVELLQAKDLPLSFWLRLEGEITLRLSTVAWRSQRQVGVEFSQQIIERRSVERRVAVELAITIFLRQICCQNLGHPLRAL